MADEPRLRELCANRIRSYLEQQGYQDIITKEQTRIIKDCTVVPEDDDFTLLMGHAETDVALYKSADELTEHFEESQKFKLYQNAENELRIPLVVLEIKSGNLTTDMIRNRNIIAREMNEIFPFLGYFFVADETDPTSRMTWRAGKHFDAFFLSNEPADRDWVRDRVIDAGVIPHLEKLEHLDVL